ncbi:hypothetical protein F2Q70_00008541 [Brassica cretica]|uniref:Ubiquitin-like protease family profile domain-containing protein n=1 Tax=Brassica cretica TaxID=69181 RepID=A0A8S9M5T6_BRACR|nr:hypothetical protein F2Q70_00008541 [Brassica cretica]
MRSDFSWTDEVLDPEVDTMLKLIDEGFRFRKDMFTGGVTAQDLYHIKVERQREKEAKEKNDIDNADTHETDSPDQNSPLPIASIVADILKDQLGGLERRLIDAMSSRFEGMERNIEGSVVDGIMSMQTAVIKALSNPERITRTAAPRRPIQPQTQPTPEGGGTSSDGVSGRRTSRHVASDGAPASSPEGVNLTTDPLQTDSAPADQTSEAFQDKRPEPEHVVRPEEANPANAEGRKSKRSRQRPTVYKDYQCDPKVPGGSKQPPSVECLYEKMVDNLNILGHIKIAPDVAVPTGEFLSIAQRTQPMTAQVMDSLVRFLPRHPTATGVNKHWVGICVDTMEGTIYILDCNTSFKTESQMKKELNPIAVIFPYILRARDPTAPTSLLKPFSVVRCGGIAQNNNPLDAAITTVLLIKGQSAGGLPGSKAITPTVITDAAKLFVLRFFEYICDNAGLPKVE